jgi:hypothetical protein
MTAPISETSPVPMTRGLPKWMVGYSLPPRSLTDYAACSPEDAWLFDARTDVEVEREGSAFVAQRIELARGICRTHQCPVMAQCLLYGLANRLVGVYGGELITEAMVKRMERGTDTRVRAEVQPVGQDHGARDEGWLVEDLTA